MNFTQLPEDINLLIGLFLDYDDLLEFCRISKIYSSLCKNPYFWKIKTMNDFHVDSILFEELNDESLAMGFKPLPEKEVYIRLAGEHNIPIVGAERYRNPTILTQVAANKLRTKKDQEKLFYFFNISKATYSLTSLGTQNRLDLLDRFVELYPQLRKEILENFLLGAAKAGNGEIVQWLLDQGINNYNSALNWAASGGNLQVINLLIDKPDVDKNMAMVSAIIDNHLNIVHYLLAYGADNYNDFLTVAVDSGNRLIMKLMLLLGANDYTEALGGAANHGYRDMIIELINHGAHSFNWALYQAALGGHLDIVQDMIRRGADDLNEGLLGAALGGHFNIVQELAQQGANNFTQVLLETLSEGNNINLDIIKFLAVRTDLKTISDQVLLSISENGNETMWNYFSSYAKPEDYNRYAIEAARYGNRSMVKLLIELGADNIEELIEAAKYNYDVFSYLNMILKSKFMVTEYE